MLCQKYLAKSKIIICVQVVWVEEHDKRSFLLDLMDAAGLGAKDLDGEVGASISQINPCSFKLVPDHRICREIRQEMIR